MLIDGLKINKQTRIKLPFHIKFEAAIRASLFLIEDKFLFKLADLELFPKESIFDEKYHLKE